jgi:hypothetical protein
MRGNRGGHKQEHRANNQTLPHRSNDPPWVRTGEIRAARNGIEAADKMYEDI